MYIRKEINYKVSCCYCSCSEKISQIIRRNNAELAVLCRIKIQSSSHIFEREMPPINLKVGFDIFVTA